MGFHKQIIVNESGHFVLNANKKKLNARREEAKDSTCTSVWCISSGTGSIDTPVWDGTSALIPQYFTC